MAVGNALPLVQERADWVTPGRNGEGVVQLIDKLIENDLTDLEDRLSRHFIPVGTRANGEEVRLDPYGLAVLVAGSSGSGKSTFATGVLERLAAPGYQFCIVDPEGDYALFEGTIVLGDKERPPTVEGRQQWSPFAIGGTLSLSGAGLPQQPLVPQTRSCGHRLSRWCERGVSGS